MRKALNDYQAQLVTAIVGTAVIILVTLVPQLEPFKENLTEIIFILLALILGQSVQKHGR